MSSSHCGGLRLDNILARAAFTHPQREAVVFHDESWTYAEVHERAGKVAGALAALGIEKGDRVAVWTANRPEFVEILFGVSQLGAVSVPMDLWWTWEDALSVIEQVRPRVLIAGDPQASIIAQNIEAVGNTSIRQVICLAEVPAGLEFGRYTAFLEGATAPAQLTPVEPEDAAVIFFTSGSTGRSKGAVHSHRSLMAAAMTMGLEMPVQDGERTLHFLPLFSSCMEHLIPLTLMRATHIVLPKFDAVAVWEAIEKYQVTHFDAIPTTLRRMMDVVPEKIPESLRSVTYASERMPEPLIAALVERMPKVRFAQFYGMIEQLCLTVLDPHDQVRKGATIGRPMIGAQLYLLSPEGKVAERGQAGEIVARSPTLFSGYWEDELSTQMVMLGSWMRTGDLGREDEQGYMVLEGRVKEIIKSGGNTVIPSEIEGILMKHPDVSEAAVVGIPDEVWGEAVHAFVIPANGTSVTESELKFYCKQRLAPYKTPKVFHIVADLPTTGIGKIARRQVRDQFLAQVKII
ncbi:MAG TPA: class I adenylate-forming enzyme family protein [Xanthomonadales bacterium]|nr:class I adenylate-forming enzyme family protein [Xanthomonadales bacterium]